MVSVRLREAEQILNVCLYYVTHKGEYIIATDSGGNQRYLVGTLDDGSTFVQKVAKDNLSYCYDLEEQL